MAGIKIVDLPALGRDLLSTDLLEMSIGGTASRKITGQEIMNASKLNVGSTPIVSGTVGRVLFQGTGDILQQSANISWDNTNVAFFLGSLATRTLIFRPQATSGAFGNSSLIAGGNGNGRLDFYSATNITQLTDNVVLLTSVGGPSIQVGVSSIALNVGGSTRLGVASTGNVLINTTTDAGFRLDVNGTARVQSKLTVGASTVSPYNFNVWGGAFESYISLNNTNSGTGSADGFQIGLEPNGTDVYFLNRENGFIQFRTADTNRVRIANTGNLLINTTTDNGYKLEVNGTGRISSSLNVGGNGTIGNSLSAGFIVQDNGNIVGTSLVHCQGAQLTIFSSPQSFAAGGFEPLSGGLSSTNAIAFMNGSTTRMKIPTTGNVLIGTTTDAGFRLDVNGTVRSQGNLFFGTAGSYLLGDANNIRIVDKNNTIILQSFPNGVSNSETYLRSANSVTSFLRLREDYISLEYNNGTISQTTQNPIQITRGFFGNVLATDKSVLHIRSPFFSNLNNATTLRGIFIDINDTTTFTGFTTVRAIEAPRGGAYFNTTSPQASAVLQADSTSQGFLPPRMTNAQRTAIVSPAVGLIVYCTDVTEGLWVYKSTGWTFIV